MPRKIETTVYKFDELAPEAQERAVDSVREKIMGSWWDASDNERITEIIVYTLANELGTPGHGDHGVSDYPGIPSVSVTGWDLDRGQVEVRGSLTRANAPRLPWVDGIDAVRLTDPRHSNTGSDIEVFFDDDVDSSDMGQVTADMEQAIRDAIHAALKSGRSEMDYMGSDGYVRGEIEANEREFTEEGTLY